MAGIVTATFEKDGNVTVNLTDPHSLQLFVCLLYTSISLLALSGVLVQQTRYYLWQHRLDAVSYTHLDVYKRQPICTISSTKELFFWSFR